MNDPEVLLETHKNDLNYWKINASYKTKISVDTILNFFSHSKPSIDKQLIVLMIMIFEYCAFFYS